MNLPNRLTILRICLIPVFVVMFFLSYDWALIVAIAVFILAACTDFLDGYIARKYNMVTDLGKLLDPIADKVLVAAALICIVTSNPLQYMYLLTFSSFDWQIFGTIYLTVCTILILARELVVDALRMIAASKGIVLQANIFGKIKTILQDVSIPLLLSIHFFRGYELISYRGAEQQGLYVYGIIVTVLFGLATLMTLISGIIYLVQNKSVFLSEPATQEDDNNEQQ